MLACALSTAFLAAVGKNVQETKRNGQLSVNEILIEAEYESRLNFEFTWNLNLD